MNWDPSVEAWHQVILADAQKRLGRSLKVHEREFIISRSGFVALEMIHDTIRTSGRDDIETYLASERSSRADEK